MAWAENGRISQDPIEGGIQITGAQYSAALAGMLDGQIVTIDGGFSIVDPPASDPAPDPVEPDPDAPYLLYKSTFIRRLSGDEAETMEAVLAAADARLRLLFNSVEYFVSNDELFGTLISAVGEALGETRAAELLATG